jgi:hypothetical protein
MIGKAATRSTRHADEYVTSYQFALVVLEMLPPLLKWQPVFPADLENRLSAKGAELAKCMAIANDIQKKFDKRNDEFITVVTWFHTFCLLADRLSESPILVNSGQETVSERVHVIVHPRQPEHDAQLELARKLVNPSEDPDEYLGHVRLPGGQYHEVKLVKPVSGTMNFAQLEEVRSRSRSLYTVSSGDESDGLDEPPPDDEPPAIGRRSPKR